MRICVSAFLLTTEPGMKLAGVGRHMLAVLNQLTITDLGNHYDVYLRDDMPLPEAWKQCQWITWHPIKIKSSSERVVWEHFLIGREALRLKSDLILSLFLSLPSFCTIPMVAIAHDAFPRTHPDWYPPRKRIILDRLTALACRKSNALVTVSEFSRRELSKAYKISASKIFVAPNGLGNDLHILSKEELSTVDLSKFNIGKFIFSVGTLEPRKNLDGLIKAFEILKQSPETKGLKLLIAGAKGWLDSAVGKTWEASPVKNEIEFLGYISDLELNALMQKAKVFVLASFVEGFGIPPLEAMTVGTPVVVSRTSSLPEVCGEFAFYCDPSSPQSIGDAMLAALTELDRVKANIEGGLDRAKEFSWYESVKKLEIALKFAVN
jgi:glycosyltransferase involved in cell wall biosynthesis